MRIALNRLVLCCFMGGLIMQSSFAASAKNVLKSQRSFVVNFDNISSKNYTLMTQSQGGVCAKGIILKGHQVSCDNIPPLKSIYVMYQYQVIGRIVFKPVVKPSGLYYFPYVTGVLKNCAVLPPNKVNCQLSNPSSN